MRLRNPLAILMLAATVSGAGCYTLLHHPAVPDMAAEESAGGDDRKACSDCHSDAEFYHDVTYGDASWYEEYPAAWAAYYEYPWWFNDYWYVAPPADGTTISVDSQGRHVWSRDSGGPGFLPVQGDQSQGNTTKPASPDKPKDTKDSKDKKDKEKRHVWGR
jgi:hypothetical protein